LLLGLFITSVVVTKVHQEAFQNLERLNGSLPQQRLNLFGLVMGLLLMAGLSGTNLGNTGGKDLVLPPFLGVRPLANPDLVHAKLKAAAWITAFSWCMVLLVVPLTYWVTGTWQEGLGWLADWLGQQPPPRACAIVLIAVCGLLGTTWLNLTSNMFLGLMGRAWIVHGIIAIAFILFISVLSVIKWVLAEAARNETLVLLLSCGLALVVIIKVFIAYWIARLSRDRALISEKSLAWTTIVWLFSTAGLFGVLLWLVPKGWTSWYYLAGAVIVAVPFNRFLAAPLALYWNRHR
jgi:hypothetical protein